MEAFARRQANTTLSPTPSRIDMFDTCSCEPTDVSLTHPLILGDVDGIRHAAAHSSSSSPHIPDWPCLSKFATDFREIGYGAFSTVRKATCKHGSTHAAVKKVSKHTKNAHQLLPNELKALQRIQGHPNIITLMNTFEDNDFVYIVTQYCANGTLFDYLVSHGGVTEQRARVWCRQLIDAVQFCHQHGVINRDIKLENVLLDSHLNIVLADFGLAALVDCPSRTRLNSATGSPVFAAPEVYNAPRAPYLGCPADMWSVGVVLHCMVTGALPFDRDDYKEEWGTYSPPETLSPQLRDLLTRLLSVDPSVRISAAAALEHPWLDMAPMTHSTPHSPKISPLKSA